MKRRVKNRILKGSIAVAVITFLLSTCCFDGESILIPIIVNVVSLLWLVIIGLANSDGGQ